MAPTLFSRFAYSHRTSTRIDRCRCEYFVFHFPRKHHQPKVLRSRRSDRDWRANGARESCGSCEEASSAG